MSRVWNENFQKYGILSMERILFEYEGIPITFVCLDHSGNRYLCHCTEPINESSWLVTPITKNELADCIQNEESLLTFLMTRHEVILATVDNKSIKYKIYTGSQLPCGELPDSRYTFINDCEDYVNMLNAKCVVYPFEIGRSKTVDLPRRKGKTKQGLKSVKTRFDRVKVSDRKKYRMMG